MAQPDSTTVKELTVDQNGVIFFRVYGWRGGKPMSITGTFGTPMQGERGVEGGTEDPASLNCGRALNRASERSQ